VEDPGVAESEMAGEIVATIHACAGAFSADGEAYRQL
jgi:hypothetical protein